MTWLTWLALALVLATAAALTRSQPKGARHVGNTHLMSVARVVLAVAAVVVAFAALHARPGG